MTEVKYIYTAKSREIFPDKQYSEILRVYVKEPNSCLQSLTYTHTNNRNIALSVRPINLATNIRKATHTYIHAREYMYIQHHSSPLVPVAHVDFIAELLEVDHHGVSFVCTRLLEYVTLTSGGGSGARIHRHNSLPAQ